MDRGDPELGAASPPRDPPIHGISMTLTSADDEESDAAGCTHTPVHGRVLCFRKLAVASSRKWVSRIVCEVRVTCYPRCQDDTRSKLRRTRDLSWCYQPGETASSAKTSSSRVLRVRSEFVRFTSATLPSARAKRGQRPRPALKASAKESILARGMVPSS